MMTTRPPPTKKRKSGHAALHKLQDEVDSKVTCLASERWAADSCDKQCEGILTRANNLKAKMLDACQVEEAAALDSCIGSLACLIEFGTTHKHGFGKTKKTSALLGLVQPMLNMMDDTRCQKVQFFSGLGLLLVQISFQRDWMEGAFQKALSDLSVSKIAKIFSDGQEPLVEHRRLANIWVLQIVEGVAIERIKMLRANKELAASTAELYEWIVQCADSFPTMEVLPSGLGGVEYPERNRAERIQAQMQGIFTIAQQAMSLFRQGAGSPPWPSKVRAARSCLADEPKTRIATALDTYAGAKQLMAMSSRCEHVGGGHTSERPFASDCPRLRVRSLWIEPSATQGHTFLPTLIRGQHNHSLAVRHS